MAGIRALLVDIDHTLVDTAEAYRVAICAVCDRWLPQLDAAGRAAAVRHWTADVGGRFRAYTRGELTFSGQRRHRAMALHEHFGGAPLDDEGFAEWELAYDDAFRGAWRAFPDAEPLLGAATAAGLLVGVVTNADSGYQWDKLTRVGLAGWFEVLVGTDALGGIGKPDPRIFTLACERLGVAPAEAAYVGDELEIDARAATGAGLLGIWLDRSGAGTASGTGASGTAGVRVVSGLHEVPAVLSGGTPGN